MAPTSAAARRRTRLLKAVEIAPIERLAARQEPRFDQRGADLGVVAGQGAGLVDGADAVAQHQPGIEDVAEQPLGQRRHAIGEALFAKDHQVHVGIGSDLAAAVAAVGDQGHAVAEQLGMIRGQPLQSDPVEPSQDLVPQIGGRGASSTPDRPVLCSALSRSRPVARRDFASRMWGRRADMDSKQPAVSRDQRGLPRSIGLPPSRTNHRLGGKRWYDPDGFRQTRPVVVPPSLALWASVPNEF